MVTGKHGALASHGIFQPWMQFPPSGWVKSALLLRERIDRMVPASSGVPDLATSNELHVLAEHGLIGDHIVTNIDADNAEQIALRRLDVARERGHLRQWIDAGRPFIRDSEYTRIHNAKVGEYFVGQLAARGIAYEERGDYLYTEPAVIALYMFTLAQILQNNVKNTCLVSDARGYAGLETLIETSVPKDDGEPLLDALVVGLSIDLTNVTSMPAADFVAWHSETAALRRGLRKKLAEIGGNSDNEIGADPDILARRLAIAQDDFNRYIAELPNSKWRLSAGRVLAFVGIALPIFGLGLDLIAGTAGLGTLVTVPAGSALSGMAIVKQWRATAWERYLVEIGNPRNSPAPSSPGAMASLLSQLGPPGAMSVGGS